jgi:VanZ family protein
VLTSIPSPPDAPEGIPHLDKVVHFAMYAVLGALVTRALRTRQVAALFAAIVGIAVFGVIDEWHQQFFTRQPHILDWLADVAGAIVGVVAASRVTSPETVQ